MREKNEPTKQFDKIFEDHHDPSKSAEREILKRRGERETSVKEDVGL
jgi:hypothetical protein